ncbi:MAG: N-formylglutamate amidohydrolase, partial [Mesorhizobium sp.]
PTRIGEAILAGLSRDGTLTVAANDYAVPIHGDDRGIPAVLVGMRQDLPADHQGVEAWAKRLAAALPAGQTA